MGIDDAAEWVKRALENSGYRVRYVRRYGRMITIKLGLLKKAYLLRHESMGRTIVCGSRDVIEVLKKQGALTEYRPVPVIDEHGKALVEAQTLERKVRSARNDLIIATAIGAVFVAVLATTGANPLAYALVPIALIIIESLPRTVILTGHTEFYIPILYPVYKRRLRELREALPSEGGKDGSRSRN